MARLIDANDAYSLFGINGLARLHVADIDTIPRVDAVEVVRCKDCMHWNELKGKDSGKPVGYGDCRNGYGINGIAYEDSFCSYGEKRDV